MGFWLTRHAMERNVGKIIFASVAGFGVATLVFALSTQRWLSLLALWMKWFPSLRQRQRLHNEPTQEAKAA